MQNILVLHSQGTEVKNLNYTLYFPRTNYHISDKAYESKEQIT